MINKFKQLIWLIKKIVFRIINISTLYIIPLILKLKDKFEITKEIKISKKK